MVMPEMGGVALLRALHQKKMDMRVLLMTGHPLNDELDALQLEGLIGWLSKPLDLAQLAQVVASALQGHKDSTI